MSFQQADFDFKIPFSLVTRLSDRKVKIWTNGSNAMTLTSIVYKFNFQCKRRELNMTLALQEFDQVNKISQQKRSKSNENETLLLIRIKCDTYPLRMKRCY
jgi:hypothetical protein